MTRRACVGSLRLRSRPAAAPARGARVGSLRLRSLPHRCRRSTSSFPGSFIPALVLLALAALAGPLGGQQTHLLVVTGLGGEPAYSARFVDWGARLVAAATEVGVAPENVVWLAEREGAHAAVTGVARADAVRGALARVAASASPGDVVVIVLFGHGTEREGEARVNLPGPDLAAAELALALDGLAPRRVVVVNTASASGPWVEALSADGRVVITATRSAREAEATRFGEHFVAALEGDGADTDKDGRVSMLEAFEYARREVARTYADASHLPTEHALLDDDGDGQGTMEPASSPAAPGGGAGDGALAARIALAPRAPTSAVASGDAVLDSLRAERTRLEAELAELRGRKEEMEAAAYDAALERLLLEVARNGRAIREREGGG